MNRILLFLLFGAGAAHAEFAQWTNKDGKAAELELLKLEKKGETEIVTFRTRAGKTVTMNLTDLQESEWQRARDASTQPAATPPAAETGKLDLRFEGAAVHPKQEVEGSQPNPGKLEFRFVVQGPNYAGIKPETLEVQPCKIGNRTVPVKSWSVTSVGGPHATPLVLTSLGNFDATKLSGSKITASVVALVGTVKKSESIEMKVPKDESKPVTGKVGPIDVLLARDVRQITVGTKPKIPQQVITYRIEGGTNNGGVSLDLVKAGDTVPVVVEYWEAVTELPLKLEATAP